MSQIAADPAFLQTLQGIRLFETCTPGELVRLLPHIQQRVVQPGDVLFNSGTPASNLFYLLSGEIQLFSQGRLLHQFGDGFFGEEAGVGAHNYLSEAKVLTEAKVWVFPAQTLKTNLGKNVTVARELYSSLFSHYSGEKRLFKPKEEKKKASPTLSSAEFSGWILAILIPVIVWILCDRNGVEIKAKLFLLVFTSISVMWVFRLTAEFIPCILGLLALLILGVAPSDEILQGFSSGEFFMAMSIFGVGAVLVTSGLTFRLVLMILKYIPPSPIFHALSMVVAGFFLTPVLPSANGRIGLVSPIMLDMMEALQYKPKGRANTSLAAGTFAGFTLFASVFLTSKPINFVVYGLLPQQVQEQFQWGGWLLGAAVSGCVIFLLTFLSFIFIYKNDEAPKLSHEQINAQLTLLGPLSIMEWTALISVVVFIIGTAISSIHKIDPPWVALAVLTFLLTLDALQRKEFHEKVDWSFILYLAGLIGLVKTMTAVGIDQMIAKNITFVGPLMRKDFLTFILVLFGAMSVVRLVVPNNATIAMFCTILLPLAQVNGINPWVIGYIILTFSDAWIFPYQCTYYLLFLELTEKADIYDSKSLWKFQLLTNLFRIAAIWASIPYWKWMGVIA